MCPYIREVSSIGTKLKCPDVPISEGVVLCTGFNGVELRPEMLSHFYHRVLRSIHPQWLLVSTSAGVCSTRFWPSPTAQWRIDCGPILRGGERNTN